MKICNKCNISKEDTEFGMQRGTCKECRHSYYLSRKDKQASQALIRKYGLAESEYQTMFENQKGLCLICEMPQKHKKTDKLCVDHDHITGIVRGLLCNTCNVRLGWYEFNKEQVDKYLNGEFNMELK